MLRPTYNVTGSKLEAKFEFLPSKFVVNVLRKAFQLLNRNGNLVQHLIHVDADATLFLC